MRSFPTSAKRPATILIFRMRLTDSRYERRASSGGARLAATRVASSSPPAAAMRPLPTSAARGSRYVEHAFALLAFDIPPTFPFGWPDRIVALGDLSELQSRALAYSPPPLLSPPPGCVVANRLRACSRASACLYPPPLVLRSSARRAAQARPRHAANAVLSPQTARASAQVRLAAPWALTARRIHAAVRVYLALSAR